MRRLLILLLLPAATVLAADAPPPLKALTGFQPGQWQVSEIKGSESGKCVKDVAELLAGDAVSAGCSFTVITDTEASGVVTYRCPSGRSGRTAIRRDTDELYMIDAQGIRDGLPFASRTEWRRSGGC